MSVTLWCPWFCLLIRSSRIHRRFQGKADRRNPSGTRCDDQSPEDAASPRAGAVKTAILAAIDASSARLFLASGRNGEAAGRVDQGGAGSIDKATRRDQAFPGSRQMHSAEVTSDAASLERIREDGKWTRLTLRSC